MTLLKGKDLVHSWSRKVGFMASNWINILKGRPTRMISFKRRSRGKFKRRSVLMNIRGWSKSATRRALGTFRSSSVTAKGWSLWRICAISKGFMLRSIVISYFSRALPLCPNRRVWRPSAMRSPLWSAYWMADYSSRVAEAWKHSA